MRIEDVDERRVGIGLIIIGRCAEGADDGTNGVLAYPQSKLRFTFILYFKYSTVRNPGNRRRRNARSKIADEKTKLCRTGAVPEELRKSAPSRYIVGRSGPAARRGDTSKRIVTCENQCAHVATLWS